MFIAYTTKISPYTLSFRFNLFGVCVMYVNCECLSDFYLTLPLSIFADLISRMLKRGSLHHCNYGLIIPHLIKGQIKVTYFFLLPSFLKSHSNNFLTLISHLLRHAQHNTMSQTQPSPLHLLVYYL